jgi:serine protease DegS
MKSLLQFVTWPAIAGLLAALLILDRFVFTTADDAQSGAAMPRSYAAAVARASPSVVSIYTAKRVTQRRSPLVEDRVLRNFVPRPPRRSEIQRSLGSGVIMTDAGHILTNEHVIAGAESIQVWLHDGRGANATVVGSDPATDLAVLKIDLPQLRPIELGDSDSARVGDVVLAIGNPLNFGLSVTQGIVSALERYSPQLRSYEEYIQTDATIHQGNSGGALVDAQGRLLGINTLIFTADQGRGPGLTGIGISFAIPVSLAVFVMQDLIDYGEVIRGWLGVSVDPLLTVDGSRYALMVVAVIPDSPAAKAGLTPGDMITHIDGEPVADGRMTMQKIGRLRPGDAIAITIQREQQSMDLKAIIGTLSQSAAVRESNVRERDQ